MAWAVLLGVTVIAGCASDDDDNEFACNDYLYAVTDDCDTNWTAQVQFQVSTNQGQTWIPLSDAINTHVDQCLSLIHISEPTRPY